MYCIICHKEFNSDGAGDDMCLECVEDGAYINETGENR